MIGRKSKARDEDVVEGPKGFDDFKLRLGDVMRGERATMGKSLLDVQRELRIKASYIAAIENCDPEAFETQGFIAGYVRSYARYLDMDPDATFVQFCAESGFSSASGMDEAAKSGRGKSDEVPGGRAIGVGAVKGDPFVNPSLPFSPANDSFLTRLEPGAIGSMTVLLALIAALGYGGWTVLQEVQRVQLAPVERTPVVLSELDPLSAATQSSQREEEQTDAVTAAPTGVFAPPSADGLDRLYRPQALDVPVLIARDAPISSLDPSQFGAFAEANPTVSTTPSALLEAGALPPGAGLDDGVTIVAVRPAWVRIRDGETVLYSGIMNAGQTYIVPADARDPNIEVGESGAVYYAVDGTAYGPAGPRGTVTSDLSLNAAVLAAALPLADPQTDSDLGNVLADLAGPTALQTAAVPQVLDARDKSVSVVAASEAWVRVRSAQGTVLFEGVMAPGDIYTVPATESAPTIRAGNAGAIYFATQGQTFGPYGDTGAVVDNLALSVDDIRSRFPSVAQVQPDGTVARAVAELNAARAVANDQ